MPIIEEVNNLVTNTSQLLNTVNVTKQALDNAVSTTNNLVSQHQAAAHPHEQYVNEEQFAAMANSLIVTQNELLEVSQNLLSHQSESDPHEQYVREETGLEPVFATIDSNGRPVNEVNRLGIIIRGGSQAIDIRRHGAQTTADIGPALTSAFLEAEERKGYVYIPPIDGAWRLETAYNIRPGVMLKGDGFHRQSTGIRGSVIRRFLNDVVMYDLPSFYTAGALPAAPVCTGLGIQGIYFDGNGRNVPVMNIQKVGNFRLLDCGVAGSGTASLIRLFNQVQDSWFERNHFEQANPANNAGVIDIDDSSGIETDHNQNLVFYGNFFEAYRGPAVRIWGKGTGPGNSLIDFIRNKLEGLNSNSPHFVVEDASQINFDYGFIAGRGTSGNTVSSVISFKNSSKSGVNKCRVGWMPSGATLTNICQLEACSTISVDLVPSFASTVDGLTGIGLVQNTGTFSTDINVSSTYRGTKALLYAGSSRLPVPQIVFQGTANRGDGGPTIEVLRDHPIQIFNTPLTANRTVTVSTTAAKPGDTFRIVRTTASSGSFTLDVGPGLKTLAQSQWCEISFNGTAWILVGFGSL